MRRGSLLLLGVSGCLVQDPAWDPPTEDTDGAGPTSGPTSTSTSASSGDPSAGSGSDSSDPVPVDDLPQDCARLGGLPSDAIVVGPMDNDSLHTIVAEAPAGSTIALEPGTYDRAGLPRIVLAEPGLTFRSTTGASADVVLDGGRTDTSSLISIAADDVLLAELTLQNSDDTLVDIGNGDEVIRGARLYRIAFRDAAGAHVDVGSESGRWTDDGVVACSSFTLSDDFRDATSDCSALSALRISGGARWWVRDNEVSGFWCSTATYAVMAADLGSSDTRFVRNTIRNAFRGILLGGDNNRDGRPERGDARCGVPDGATWGHVRGLIANNVIWADDPRMAGAAEGYATDLDSMIGFWHVCAGAAVHNTSYVTLTTFNGIEWRYPDTSVTIANNLISTILMEREEGNALGLETNGVGAGADQYVDPAAGNFRLAPGATARDAGVDVPGFPLPLDFEGQPRVGRPDLGAFEFQP